MDEQFTRREFLLHNTLGASAVAITLGAGQGLANAADNTGGVNCIILLLTGGPSHIDTWDPKPCAPADVRGPFRSIRTRVPGMHISECFPLMAQSSDLFSIVRSFHHHDAPIHETGQQLMQTGNLSPHLDYPHYGSVLSYLYGPGSREAPTFVVAPDVLGNTGMSLRHGQDAGFLGSEFDPTTMKTIGLQRSSEFLNFAQERLGLLERYGKHSFGRCCLAARRLIERGTKCVGVNMYHSLENKITWDCHAHGPALPTTLDDYRTIVCPMFDQSFTALLIDLKERGMLDSTLVVAMGEFGRSPQINAAGGRDHWPGVWSILLAGGGVRGGNVIGASDRTASEPHERPVTPAELAATIYGLLDVPLDLHFPTGDGGPLRLIDSEPVTELF